MRVQKRAERRRREERRRRRACVGGEWELVEWWGGSVGRVGGCCGGGVDGVDSGADILVGLEWTGDRVVASSFSPMESDVGVSDIGGSHCFAIFFSTSMKRRKISTVMSVKAM